MTLHAEDLTDHIVSSIPILGQMGIEVVVAERGKVTARLPFDPNRNHVSTAYAGSLFSVAEVLGGILAATTLVLDGFVPIVKSVEIAYKRPALGAVTATATLTEPEIDSVMAAARAAGKADYVVRAIIADDDGSVVATTVGVYQLGRFG